MDWFKLDTGLFEDQAVRDLIESEGDEGFRVWLQTRLEVVNGIDFRNEDNGELSVPGGKRSPLAYVSFFTGKSEGRVREIFDSCAELGLIDTEGWKDDRIYFPELLERDSVQGYLKQQRAGQKGGQLRGDSRDPSSPPSTDTDVDIEEDEDTDQDVDEEKPEPDDSDLFSEDQLREKFGAQAVKYTNCFIERSKEINPRRSTPDKGTELYLKWVQAFDRLHRIGPAGGTEGETGYSWEELNKILRYAFNHEGQNGFSWKDQVRSPVQLRKRTSSDEDPKIVKIEDSMNSAKGKESDFHDEWEDAV